ncbi:MAG: hypothetical protein BAJATHORv1_20172 [Candidatus Thorarchaeota archaeon]|nr:MAG: hypothetical protein BAJATHORv1_20172 [Candidatus Thorarchaeota archaeon]
MLIRFKSFGPLRRLLTTSELTLEMPEDATVNDVIHTIIESSGSDARQLLYDSGKFSGNFIVLVNKTDVDRLDGLNTRLSPGDQVIVLPHVQGG